MRALAISALLTLGLDQASKAWVLGPLDLARTVYHDIWPPYLTFRMAWNEGINFGLFGGLDARWFLIGLAIAVCLGVLAWVVRTQPPTGIRIAAGLLIGGAIGNVIDRLRFGAVADFINMSCCGIDNPYAFNIADIGVFAGAIGIMLLSGRDRA